MILYGKKSWGCNSIYFKSGFREKKKTNKKFDVPNKCLCGSKIIKIEGEAVQRCSAGKMNANFKN